MNFVYKIPGPLLILTGGFCLSWGGLILRTFESASIWQILFYRSIFFLWVLIAFILLTYGKKTFKKIKEAGVPGLIGGIFLSTSLSSFLFENFWNLIDFARYKIIQFNRPDKTKDKIAVL